MEKFDAIVIGAGQGGDPLARAWASAGRKVAIVERRFVGGTCVNTGCTPTKTLAASARVAHLTRRAADFGVHYDGTVSVNMAEVRDRAQAIVKDFRQGTEKNIQAKGAELIYGQARFTGPKSVRVALNGGGDRELAADQIFINVGTRPAAPSIDGLTSIPYLDNASIEQLDTLPEHLLILGGSYIALEFGQMFRRFGSAVTIVERAERLLAREDPDVSEEIEKILREDGIEIYTGAKAAQISKDGAGVALTIRPAAGPDKTLTGSHLLAATGRIPNTDDLGLDTAGVETDEHGFIKADATLETNVPGVYVIGDCKGGPQFTHISYDDFRILCANLMDGKNITTHDRPVPYTVFTDPQLGRVGMSETEARQAGRNIAVAKIPMTEVARAIETSETRGFMKAVVDADTEQILGCAILSIEGGEIMAVLEMAMLGHVPYTVIRDGVFAHPTLAESLNNLFMSLDTASPPKGKERRSP